VKVVAAIADGPSGELAVRRMGGATEEVADFCAGLPAPVRVAYEAGPTGFGLARALRERGIPCVVAAPGKIERPATDRVKTDRRDAERLVRLLMIGGLHAVRVPTPAEEAMRDLVRAREDVRGDLMRARHRVGKLLLRPTLRGQQLDGAPSRMARPDRAARAGGAVGAARRGRVDRGPADASPGPRGPDGRAGPGLAVGASGRPAEVPARDRHPLGPRSLRRGRRLRSLRSTRPADELPRPVPSENTTGEKRRQGSITRSGSRHARRLLVEAAWHYRRVPRRSRDLRSRQEGQPQSVCAISWKAQQRLHRSWVRLDHERGKRRTLCAVAVARELTGFCWAVTTAD